MKQFKAILWDCDGVLIDSEVLACAAAAKVLSKNGFEISLDAYIERFMGKGLNQILAEIDAGAGTTLSKDFPRAALQAEQKEIFTEFLKATDGIKEVLAAAAASNTPMAVASGSEMVRLQHTLGITGLAGFFAQHVYSADMVKNGKPAPDIFLLAAAKLGVDPKDCLVIEDGIHGIKAAKAAGMTVYGYIGGSHMTEDLKAKVRAENPDRILTDIRQMLDDTPAQKSAPRPATPA